MEHLRYLLVTIASLTLIMSVFSSVSPSYFAGVSAFAVEDEEDDDDHDDNSGSSHNTDKERDDASDDESSEEDEHELVQSLGNHSKVTLETDEAELGVEIEDGDLDDGTYDVMFACDRPVVGKEFTDSLNVTEGHGKFEADLALSNGTYTGCGVEIDELSVTFPSFNIIPDKEHNEEDGEEHEEDNETNDSNLSSQSNRHDDDVEEDDDDNSGRGSHNEGSTEDKRNERKERIVNTTSGAEIHERHRNANPHSPGDYDPNWNYTLTVNGTVTQGGGSIPPEFQAVVGGLDMSVWKSNRAIILLDVVGGTVEIDNNDYTVRIGYAIYSTQHDVMKVVALATNDDGNIYSLRLRGHAADEGDQFPMESGSIDLVFGGNVDKSSNRFEEWSLRLEGTVEAN